MRTTFTVRNKEYELALEKRDPAEGEKNHPYTATVTGRNGPDSPVRGTLLFTQGALDAAQKMAAARGASVDQLLVDAGGRALAAEVVIRKLKSDFSFVADHRWLAS